MRILFLTENFPPERNAAAGRVFERAVYWTEAGHHVTVITGAPNFPEGRVYPGYRNRWYQTELMGGVRVVRVKTFVARNEGVILRTLDFVSFMGAAFAAGLVASSFDVVVATSPQFFTAVAGWAVAAARRRPFVFELGDLWPASITATGVMRDNLALRLVERVELFLYRRSAAVVALTEAFKNDLTRRGIDRDKITVVLNGVDLRRYEPQVRNAALAAELDLHGRFVVGYLGTHGLAHALDRVLEAAAELEDDPEIRFLFVGAGATRDGVMAEAQRRGLNNVVFLSAQPKERMPALWSVCDVALVHLKNTPTFATVIPSKIFEAMAMGVPLLVAAPEGEATRLVRTTRAGAAVAPEAPSALAAEVRRLKADRVRLAELATQGRRAARGFSRERQAREMLAVLERATGAPVGHAVPSAGKI
jgi:putative colanic acid biosynthesis glycosyltransferase WcaI